MSVLRFFTDRAPASARLLIDIGAATVAGACVTAVPGKAPEIRYGKRVPIEPREGEEPLTAMTRALDLILDAILHEGLPKLGHPDKVRESIVALDAPWQKAFVRIEEERGPEPFTFTKHMLAAMRERARVALGGDMGSVIEMDMATVRLNGYETSMPFGKPAHRAALVIVARRSSREVTRMLETHIHAHFHGARIRDVSGILARHEVVAAAYPQEYDLLVLHEARGAIALSLARQHTLVALYEAAIGMKEQEWGSVVAAALKELASKYPLPRTIYLLADEDDAAVHARMLKTSNLGSLWLTEAPPALIEVSTLPRAKTLMATGVRADIRLLSVAEYAARS